MSKDSINSVVLRDESQLFVGTNIGDLLQLVDNGSGAAALPAIDGANLTGVLAESAKTDALETATGVVDVSAAAAPTTGQVLKATNATHATWQSLGTAAVLNSGTTAGTLPILAAGDKYPAIDGSNITALNATQLTSGTVPDARFPATLPAASGVNLTALNATNLGSGTVPDARFPATLPAASGINLTALNGTNVASGTVAAARLGTMTGDSGAGGAKGAVPAPAAGDAAASKFLKADGTWATAGGYPNLGPSSAASSGGIAFGDTASALGAGRIAFGGNSLADADYGIAIGYSSYAVLGIALGRLANAGSGATALGYISNANGANSVALGVSSHTIATGSLALGVGAYADRAYERTTAADGAADNGKKRYSDFPFKATTTDATATEIFLGGVANSRLTLGSTNQGMAYQIMVLAYDTTDGAVASFNVFGSIKRNGSDTVSLANTVPSQTTSFDAALTTASVAVTADDTNKSLKIAVTGVAGKTIDWVARVSTVEYKA